ncbi:hypothetical protein HJB89_11105 [Rhizobium sp. NZLR8]|uniref:hypothetical protein n=1 Tax=Rhizobium sp. NZLR8 TaxID=2731104 RepID=UPI001C83EC13|nr:hypothetical protein [Rhizobium sp. NZLR8]MBX5157670.1 hypothetical protein [Rhizobium sp. NZLR8]
MQVVASARASEATVTVTRIKEVPGVEKSKLGVISIKLSKLDALLNHSLAAILGIAITAFFLLVELRSVLRE